MMNTTRLIRYVTLRTCHNLFKKVKPVQYIQPKCFCSDVAKPLRRIKPKSSFRPVKALIDLRYVEVRGGNGGDGRISMLSIAGKQEAGVDGGNGGNGGHVIFQACANTRDLSLLKSVVKAEPGENGSNKDCHGKCAEHTIIGVPIGTVIKRMGDEKVIGDLKEEGMMFVAARGGAGGHGNAHFKTDTNQAPQIAEIGGKGETLRYIVELKCMADFGLLGLPNAGKSTFLRAISRARPKVASYPFTTLDPYLGIIHYDDYEQVAVADLPGLIEDSHLNKGLGIKFLKHAERCAALLIVVDLSEEKPWHKVEVVRHEMYAFSEEMRSRDQIIVGNKIDMPGAEENFNLLKKHFESENVVGISAKYGNNLLDLLTKMKQVYDRNLLKKKKSLILVDETSL